MAEQITFDGVLVVGAGLAGLAAALAAGPRQALVLSPGPLTKAAASAWAQGGMAAALSPDDSPALHAADTVAAGAGLTDPAIAALLAREAPAAVSWLADLGVPFDRKADGSFALGLEAAHSRPRIAKVRGDQAGLAVMKTMARAAGAAPHIEIREGLRVRALLRDGEGRITGVLAEGVSGLIEIAAPATILATGGIGGLYAVTTNPPTALGGGMAMAALAGARIAEPEFVQFHPTAIDVGRDPAPLATEALRGEGAILVDRDGKRFMDGEPGHTELAPRDVVARAVHGQIAEGGGAFLDAREAVGERFPEDFPTVFTACMAAGVDPRIQPIPIAPAAHYHMGGIAADANGQTSLEGLFASGECACTGVHGANRLASNSLVEAVVFGRRAGATAAAGSQSPAAGRAEAPPLLPAAALQQLRRAMSRDAGVVRDGAGLDHLLEAIGAMEATYGEASPLVAARLITTAAAAREESRGGHCRADYPDTAANAAHTLMTWTHAPAAASETADA
jgi:L-aspartate oxidase